MKSAIFAVLLIIAGVHGMPQSDVDPAQGRIVDIFLRGAIQQLIVRIRSAGLDPVNIEKREFNLAITPGWIEFRGAIEDLEFTGLSNIVINNLYYNILFGRLEFDLSIPELSLRIGKANGVAVIRGSITEGDLSGSLVLTDIRLKGDALLILTADWVSIYNINPEFGVAKIESELTVIGSQDYSDSVNEFINVRIPAFFNAYRGEINTILGEVIRYVVSWWDANRPRDLFLE